MRGELCLRVLVRANERACAQGDAAFAPFLYRAWPLCVTVECPASHGVRACDCVCVCAGGQACVHCIDHIGEECVVRCAALRASRVMRETVYACVR